jgi:hypothetical protein
MIAAGTTSEVAKRKEPTRVRLTKRSIESIPAPDSGRIAIFDEDLRGFCLVITSAGSRVFYLYRKVHGRPQRIRIGNYPELAPEAARKLVEKAVGEIADGKDPMAERRRRRQVNRQDPSFAEVLAHALEHH